jgi:signal transduction histidine kinase/CheY-like chemotaxis protein
MPAALVNIVADSEQRCLATNGPPLLRAIPRENAFCAHSILSPRTTLVIPDATSDRRFAENPLVTGPEHIRFYAGAPLVLPGDDFAVGALCVVDTRPRNASSVDLQSLDLVAVEVSRHLGAFNDKSDALGKTRALLAGLSAGAAMVSGDNLWINDALVRMTGYTRNELSTVEAWFHRLFGERAAAERARYDFASSRNFRVPLYATIRNRDDEERTLEISQSRADGVEIWFLTDITLIKDTQDALVEARDAAEAAFRAKAEFLATMSHELRTPMNGVLGMTEILLDTKLTDAQRECAETVRTQGEALLRVVEDVLDYSALEAQRVMLQNAQFSPRAAVEEAALLFAKPAADKDLSLVVDAAGVSESALGDVARIRQVLGQLLSNAVKFTQQGKVVVKAVTEPCADEKLLLRVTVGDTGVGIAEGDREKVFGAFVQADGRSTRLVGGTGLGLAICRAIVALMGGDLTLESEVGRGTTVTLSLVLPEGPKLPARWERNFSGRRALVVGEGAAIEAVLASLQSYGVACDRAPNWSLVAANGAHDVRFCTEASFRAGHVDVDAVPVVVLRHAGSAKAKPLPQTVCALSVPMKQADIAGLMMEIVAAASKKRTLAGRACSVVGGTALVVDDNPVNLKVASTMLLRLGWKVDTAKNGEEAVAAAQARPYDLVLMDCQMPVLDGYEATKRLRAIPETKDTFVVALTANALTGDREHCQAVGMNDFLSKPIRPAELQRILDIALSRL